MADKLPIDERGKVRVWQIDQQKWVNLHPVDAREQIRRGIVSLKQVAAADAMNAAGEPSSNLLPSVHLEDLTVKELEQYVEANEIAVDLGAHRLKEEKVAAIKAAIAEGAE